MSNTDLPIVIKVDASSAKPAVDAVHDSLAKVEAQGPSVSAALSKGLRDSGTAADKSKQSLDGVADALKRQEAILERIHGPERDHIANMQALDALYRKNQISAKEYEEQVARLHEELSRGKGGGEHEESFKLEGAGQAIAGRFGEVGEVFHGLASEGTLATAAVIGVGAEVVHLSDEYAQLENAVAKLAGGTRATNDVLDEQLSLAGDLHASLEQTIELSTVVKERTADLNLTAAQQLELTRALGDAARVENKSMGDAAGVLSRVGFALEAGLPAGRALKDLMREYPVLADAMRDHFGVSTKTIVEMGNKGTISLKDFTEAVRGAADSMHEEAETRAVGLGTRLGHLKDTILETKFGLETLSDAIAPGLRELERQNAATEAHTAEVKKNTEEIMANVEAVKQLEFANSELITGLNEIARAMSDGTKILDDNAKKYDDAAAKVRAYRFAVDDIKGRIDDIRKNHPELSLDKMLGAQDVATIRALRDAEQELSDAGSRHGAVLADIHKKERDRRDGIADLREALQAGEITQTEYTDAIKQYIPQVTKAITLAEHFREAIGIKKAGLGDAAEGVQSVSDALIGAAGIHDEKGLGGAGEATELMNENGVMGALDHAKIDDGWKHYEEQAKKTSEAIQHALEPIGKTLLDAAKTGKFAWQDLARSALDGLEQMLLKALEVRAAALLTGLFEPAPLPGFDFGGGGGGGGLGGAGASLFGGAHADGGSYTAPHTGGSPDSIPVMFRMSPGERADFTPKGAPSASQGPQGSAPQVLQPIVHVSMPDNNRALREVVHGSDGETATIKHIGRNAPQIRAILGIR